MNPNCYTCSFHNLSCNGILSGTCYRYRPVGSKHSPEFEELKLQLDRIEAQNAEIISLLSCPISKQEERHNQIISDYNRERPAEIEDADDIDTYGYDTDQLSF